MSVSSVISFVIRNRLLLQWMSFFPLTVSIVTTRGIWHYNIISNLLYPGHDTMILLFFSLTPCNHRRNGSLKGSYYTIFHLFFSPWGPLTLLITFFAPKQSLFRFHDHFPLYLCRIKLAISCCCVFKINCFSHTKCETLWRVHKRVQSSNVPLQKKKKKSLGTFIYQFSNIV